MHFLLDRDADHGRVLGEMVHTLTASTPPAPAGPATAGLARQALSDGRVSPEDIALGLDVLGRAGITPENLAAGVTLPTGAVGALTSFFGSLPPGVMRSMLDSLGRSPDPRAVQLAASMRDGFPALSNEHVVDAGGAHGGYDRVPAAVRHQLERPGSVPAFEDRVAWMSPEERASLGDEKSQRAVYDSLGDQPELFQRSREFGGMSEFWDRMRGSSGAAGTELSMRLFGASSTLSAGVVDGSVPASDRPAMSGISSDPRGLGQSMLDVAGRNHEAAARILTGDLDGDGRQDAPPSRMLDPLWKRDWADGGAALGRAVDWMSGDLGGPPHTPAHDRAAAASVGLHQFLSGDTNWTSEGHVEGELTGKATPALATALAQGMKGTLPFLSQTVSSADLPPGWNGHLLDQSVATETPGADVADRYDRARRTLAMIGADPRAQATLMGAGRDDIVRLHNAGDDAGAGRMIGILRASEHDVQAEIAGSDLEAQKEMYKDRERIADMLSGAGTGPLGGIAGVGAGALAPALKELWLGDEPKGPRNPDVIHDDPAARNRAFNQMLLDDALSRQPLTEYEKEVLRNMGTVSTGPGAFRPPANAADLTVFDKVIMQMLSDRDISHVNSDSSNSGFNSVLPLSSEATMGTDQPK